MKSQVLHTVWCHISCEAAGEFWHWSLSGVKGLIGNLHFLKLFWKSPKFIQISNEAWIVFTTLPLGKWPMKSAYLTRKSTSLRLSNRVFDPFTPESDQCQNSPAASQEIWHHTVWRTWLFIAYSDEKWLYYKFSLHHSYNRFLKGWENTLFELRSERVNEPWVRMSFLMLSSIFVPDFSWRGCPAPWRVLH